MTKTWRTPAASAVALGLGLALAQLLWVTAVGESYVSLCNWDCAWYGTILTQGYVSTVPPVAQRGDLANVAFFPGYPLLARWLGWVLRTDWRYSLLAVSQLSTWAFWSYLLLLLRAARASRLATAFAVLAVFCHPTAFYLVAGYSEGLFAAALLGFLYWAARLNAPAGARTTLLACVHGVALTATRLAGAPVAFAPLAPAALAALRAKGLSPLARPSAVAAIASLGAFGFFAFCRLKFGHWDLYMQTLRIGWGVWSDGAAIADPKWYLVGWDAFGRALTGDVWKMSTVSVPLTALHFVAMAVVEAAWAMRRPGVSRWRERVGLYAAAWAMFHLSVCGRASLQMVGMARYTMPVYTLLVLAAAHLSADARPARLGLESPAAGGPRRSRGSELARALLTLLLGAALAAMLAGQSIMAYMHSRGRWAS